MAVPEVKVKIGADTAALERGVANAQKTIANLGKIAAAATAAAAAGLVALTKSSFDNIDATSKQARSLGIEVKQFQALSHVAKEAGVEMDAFSAVVGIMQRNISELGKGGKAQEATFKRLGVSFDEIRRLTPDKQFQALATALSKVENPTEKTALAMEVFGRSGRQVIGMIDDLNENVEKATEYQRAFGLQIDDETAAAVESFNDGLDRLKGVFVGIGNTIAKTIAPALNALVLWMEDAIMQSGGLDNILRKVGNAFGFVFDALKLVIGVRLVFVMASWANAVLIFGRALATANLSVVAFTASLRAKITAIALVAGLVMKLTGTYEDFEKFLATLGNKILESLPKPLRDAMEDAKDTVLGVISDIESFKNPMEELSGSIRDTDAAFGELGDRAGEVFTIMDNAIPPVVGGIKDIGIELDNTSNKADETAIRLNRIGLAAQSAFANFVTGASSARQALSQLLSTMAQMFAERAFMRLFGGFSFFQTPSFAGGGFTGYGSRSGGMDGRGGFPAILHPNETVIDHTRGQSAGGVLRVIVEEAPGFASRVRTEATGVAVQVVQAGIQQYDRLVAPATQRRVAGDPRRVG